MLTAPPPLPKGSAPWRGSFAGMSHAFAALAFRKARPHREGRHGGRRALAGPEVSPGCAAGLARRAIGASAGAGGETDRPDREQRGTLLSVARLASPLGPGRLSAR